jgi:hypothetical protein
VLLLLLRRRKMMPRRKRKRIYQLMFLQLDDVVHLQLGQPLLLLFARVFQRKRSRQRGREAQLERRSRLREKWPESSTDMNALLMGAQITLTKEECALSMEQRSSVAAVMGAQT